MLIDQSSQALDGVQAAFDRLAALCCLGAGSSIGLETTLGLFEATLEEGLTLEEPGIAHFEVAAAAGQQRRLRVELDRKSTRLNSSHIPLSRMPSSA